MLLFKLLFKSLVIIVCLQSFRSGTTALVVLHFPEDKMMHVAWAGDSQALLVKNGETVQIVNSHKACREVGINLIICKACF